MNKMNEINKMNEKSNLKYDVKGQVGNEMKSYYEMSDAELEELMKTERFSLTCAPGGENNRGMEIIGRMPIKGEGFTANDIEGLGPYFNRLMPPIMNVSENLSENVSENLSENVNVLNLNEIGRAHV